MAVRQGHRGDHGIGDVVGHHEPGVAEQVHAEPPFVGVHRPTALHLTGGEIGTDRLAAAQVEDADARALELEPEYAHGVLDPRVGGRVGEVQRPWRRRRERRHEEDVAAVAVASHRLDPASGHEQRARQLRRDLDAISAGEKSSSGP